MTLVVEFAGAPGAGKSTVCRAVAGALASAGVTVEDRSLPSGRAGRRRRLARKAAGAVLAFRRPTRVARVFHACHRSGLTGRELFARTVNLVVLDAACRRSGPDVVLMDQGLVQEVTSVAATADHRTLLAALPSDLWTGVDVVVRLRVPAAVLVDRVRLRGTGESRLERLDGPTLGEALDRAEAVLDVVLAGPEQGDPSGVQVWDVDGADAALTDELVARIRWSAGG